mmetsp:Transcript_25169/g.60079  ORF Transcript_25169/g.60079 Transcript_25169/m.60079 type:complete len:280 (-) Transcript_25169:84-923(-)
MRRGWSRGVPSRRGMMATTLPPSAFLNAILFSAHTITPPGPSEPPRRGMRRFEAGSTASVALRVITPPPGFTSYHDSILLPSALPAAGAACGSTGQSSSRQAKSGAVSPTSTATSEKCSTPPWCVTIGADSVILCCASLVHVYATMPPSMAPSMMARPRGSAARNCPGVWRLHPGGPTASTNTRSNWFWTGQYCSTTIRPASDPTTSKSTFAPGSRRLVMLRTIPKHSAVQRDAVFPSASRRRSSSVLPCATATSCWPGDANEPVAVHVTAADCSSVSA